MTTQQKFDKAIDAGSKLAQFGLVRAKGFVFSRCKNARQERRYKHWCRVAYKNMVKIWKRDLKN